MENLMFSLNATVPIFLLMLLGLLFRKLGWIDEEFAAKLNKFVFLVPLPVLLFGDLATVDFSEVWNPKFVLFCFAATFLCIGIAALCSLAWKDRSIQGEFIQASYRSSAALLGIAFIQNIYGNAGMAPARGRIPARRSKSSATFGRPTSRREARHRASRRLRHPPQQSRPCLSAAKFASLVRSLSSNALQT